MYEPKINSIVDYVATVLATVSGVELSQVHDGERDIKDKAVFLHRFWDHTKSRVHGYEIAVDDSRESYYAMMGVNLRTHRLRIMCTYGIYDGQTDRVCESEREFRLLTENICSAFRSDLQLGGLVQESEPASVVVRARGTRYEYAVHQATIEWLVHERVW